VELRSLSGQIIKPRKPKPEQMDIEDIANALDKICRYSGQLPETYSVAAHSLEVANLVESEGGTVKECLTALLHDASEAYCQDVPSPIKHICKDYIKIEARFQKAIAKRFGLIYPFPKIVKDADVNVRLYEKLFQVHGYRTVDYIGRSCRKEFLRRFFELGGKK
jgi:hypothetical protein